MAPPIAPKTLRSPSPGTLPEIRYEKDTTAAGKDFFPMNKLINRFFRCPGIKQKSACFSKLAGI
ncbi:hypothetical protein [Peribacillus frigoritolerans]|uniref:hypothetical protein n=1 Tax=Peribacillus frigoritolerans TaxID=450367 RepID=UPI0007BEF471